MSSSGSGASSSSTGRRPDLQPLPGQRPLRRLPRRSPRSFRRKTSTFLCVRSMKENVSPSSWSRQGFRSAGRPVWSPLDRTFPPLSLPWGLPAAWPWPLEGSNPGISERFSSTTKTVPLPLSCPWDLSRMSGMPMPPAPSTGGSPPLPTHPFPKCFPPGSAPTNTSSPTFPTIRSSRGRWRSGD